MPTCENPVTRPRIEPGSPWWEASTHTHTSAAVIPSLVDAVVYAHDPATQDSKISWLENFSRFPTISDHNLLGTLALNVMVSPLSGFTAAVTYARLRNFTSTLGHLTDAIYDYDLAVDETYLHYTWQREGSACTVNYVTRRMMAPRANESDCNDTQRRFASVECTPKHYSSDRVATRLENLENREKNPTKERCVGYLFRRRCRVRQLLSGGPLSRTWSTGTSRRTGRGMSPEFWPALAATAHSSPLIRTATHRHSQLQSAALPCANEIISPRGRRKLRGHFPPSQSCGSSIFCWRDLDRARCLSPSPASNYEQSGGALPPRRAGTFGGYSPGITRHAAAIRRRCVRSVQQLLTFQLPPSITLELTFHQTQHLQRSGVRAPVQESQPSVTQ
ncbi:hypothetical protein PR048_005803 [Dryococelus australis]|uniref:Uncharacterized protein n=1 Tax=Dryococelus australis TaxID=614101 RepID=A0ABQ9I975_9NEOP|nr:hypothetical protein PR048_005803 [Dryococelus australis]